MVYFSHLWGACGAISAVVYAYKSNQQQRFEESVSLFPFEDDKPFFRPFMAAIHVASGPLLLPRNIMMAPYDRLTQYQRGIVSIKDEQRKPLCDLKTFIKVPFLYEYFNGFHTRPKEKAICFNPTEYENIGEAIKQGHLVEGRRIIFEIHSDGGTVVKEK